MSACFRMNIARRASASAAQPSPSRATTLPEKGETQCCPHQRRPGRILRPVVEHPDGFLQSRYRLRVVHQVLVGKPGEVAREPPRPCPPRDGSIRVVETGEGFGEPPFGT